VTTTKGLIIQYFDHSGLGLSTPHRNIVISNKPIPAPISILVAKALVKNGWVGKVSVVVMIVIF
jgi:hypothetical protein